eukprot:TRINITY_DN26995_c0_g1_i1.p1 TRINITY_DN26995_c0_g1~~TRINITY_DN26995_c0_g1_i1.p1  ORF type:complete len:976 (+),score=153.16 TRINITY_DN26995_c0_g1_i1:67-2928(+)
MGDFAPVTPVHEAANAEDEPAEEARTSGFDLEAAALLAGMSESIALGEAAPLPEVATFPGVVTNESEKQEVSAELAPSSRRPSNVAPEYLQWLLQQAVLENKRETMKAPTMRDLFELSDKDGDGMLTFGEMELMQTALDMASMSVAAVKVSQLLALRADPNAPFEFTDAEVSRGTKAAGALALGRKQFHGPVLVVAVMKRATDVVEALVRGGADTEATYSCKAGAMNATWAGTPVFFPVGRGDLGMVKLLARLNARLDAQSVIDGKPGATLLWQASYFEQLDVMRYLLRECNGLLEISAAFQDNTEITHTPLHIAAKFGKASAVQLLIDERAAIDSMNAAGDTPLADAIDHCHIEVIKLLVEQGASVFCASTERARIDANNALVDATIAQGLNVNQSVVEGMEKKDLLKFLSMRGNAPKYILSALFVRRRIMYWESHGAVVESRKDKQTAFMSLPTEHMPGMPIAVPVPHMHMPIANNLFSGKTRTETSLPSSTNSQVMRLEVKTAEVSEADGMNVAVGPDWSEFDDLFKKRQTLSDDVASDLRMLKQRLAPQDTGKSQVMVELAQCLLSNIHCDADVFFALTNSPNEEIFDTRAAQSMVINLWHRTRSFWIMVFIANFMSAFLFAAVCMLLNSHTGPSFHTVASTGWKWVLLIPLGGLYVFNVSMEVLQACGYWRFGKFRRYIFDVGNLVDICRVICSGVITVKLYVSWQQLKYWDLHWKNLLAFTALLRWLRVVMCLKGFRVVGPRMLPILRATANIKPFILVVLFPLLGVSTCYVALDIADVPDSFISMYRLGFLGDFDLAEIEGATAQSGLNWSDPRRLPSYIASRFIFVFASLFLTITMMNIFIGVLGTSYTEAYEHRTRVFTKARAQMLCDWLAMRDAWILFSRLWRRKTTVSTGEEETQHLWYCCQAGTEECELGVKERLLALERSTRSIALTLNELLQAQQAQHQ